MHAITVLREDHERIAALLCALDGAGGALDERLRRELTVHMLAEDNVFLPQVEEAIEDSKRVTAEFFEADADLLDEASALISTAYENHREVRALLEEKFDAGELRRLVEAHIVTEEGLFPKAQKVLEEEDFERIGDLIEHCKWQVRGLAQSRLASSSSFRPLSASIR